MFHCRKNIVVFIRQLKNQLNYWVIPILTVRELKALKKSFNALLTGKSGFKTYRKDKSGNVIENISTTQKYDAHDVTLSIDKHLQSMVFREIKKAVAENKAESGTAVLVSISTGEILAMATAPSYNPNNILGSQAEMRRNRAITDTLNRVQL